MFAVWEYEEGQLAIYLISKISIGSYGSDVRWKAIP